MSIEAYFHKPQVNRISSDFFSDNERIDSCLTNKDYNVAIIGIEEGVNSVENSSCSEAPNAIREQLYALRGGFKKLNICDLGNINKGNNAKENYLALQNIVTELTEKGVVCIILGGSHDLSLPIFKAIAEFQEKINISIIDGKIDLGKDENDFNSFSFVKKLLQEKKLRRLESIAYQSYFVSESQLNVLKEKNQYATRLGVVRKNIHSIEPLFRDSDISSFDMSAVRQADSPAYAHSNPNGLIAEEICQLSLYAGYSDRMKAFGIFELNPDLDINNQSSGLAAQMIWHFLEGLNNRQEDFPKRDIELYQKYFVQHNLIDENIVFYNNEMNNRWWIEIPNTQNEKEIYACDVSEYDAAKSGKIPDIWLKYFKR